MILTGERRKQIAINVLKETEDYSKEFCDIESVIIHLEGLADWSLKDIKIN